MKVYRPIIEDKLELCNADGEVAWSPVHMETRMK
jgi:hypothetical protein